MDVAFTSEAFETFINWQETDKQTFRKIKAIIADTCREPFVGLGKPEPLKYDLSGYWSHNKKTHDEIVRMNKVKTL